MSVSRRGFLKLLLVAAGTAGAGYFVLKKLNPVRALYISISTPALELTPTGSLDDRILRNLVLSVGGLTGLAIGMSHYEDYFQWRSEHLEGYRDLYKQFSTTLDEVAGKNFGSTFADCEMAECSRILNDIRPAGRLDKLRKGVLKKDWLLFENYIVREILSLFARTDALIMIGYESWPGTPRGLSFYTKAP